MMPAWAVSLLEAMARLLVALAGCEEPCLAAQDYATEMADDINNLAYRLEHEDED